MINGLQHKELMYKQLLRYKSKVTVLITLHTVLLKGNVANERLSLLVSRSNSHATRETKRTELKPL